MDLKLNKTEVLQNLFGKHLYKRKWTNNIFELSLSNMDLNDEHFIEMDEDGFNFFRSMPMLKELNISSNNLTLHSAHWIAKGILQNENMFLHKLNLYGNQLSNKGIKLIVHSLANCKNLKHLNIGGNDIDDGGVADINMLIDPSSKSYIKLKALLIHDNRLTSVGCSKILSCLKKKLTSKKNKTNSK